jgi:hypothetical protein
MATRGIGRSILELAEVFQKVVERAVIENALQGPDAAFLEPLFVVPVRSVLAVAAGVEEALVGAEDAVDYLASKGASGCV